MFGVYQPSNSSGTFNYSFFGQSGAAATGGWTVLQSRTEIVTGDPYFAGFNADLGSGLTTPNTSQKLAWFHYTGTNGSLYKNGTLIQSAAITLAANSAESFYIGTSTASEFANGWVQEVISYTSDKSSDRTTIESNINTDFSIY